MNQKKGTYEYLKNKQKLEVIKTIILFGIALSLYLAGYITVGSNKNYLTIVAVLGCLPASRSAVNMIMSLKAKGCSKEVYQNILNRFPDGVGAYHFYFTSYDKNFDISHVFVKGMTIIAFTENGNTPEADFEEHVKTVLTRDSIKGVNVKLYKDLDKYLLRIDQMLKLEHEKNREQDIMKTLFSVSL